MSEERPLCPYCGAHNGHPDGVEMNADARWKRVHKTYGEGYIRQYRYKCPICGTLSPEGSTLEEATEKALRRLHPMQRPQWISVKDRMPDNYSFVLAFIHGSPHDKDYDRIEVLGYDANEYQPEWDYVTHWMPLPEEPTAVGL